MAGKMHVADWFVTFLGNMLFYNPKERVVPYFFTELL